MDSDNDTKQIKKTTTPAELISVEELSKIHAVPDWVYAGMMMHYAWGAGKELTEAEFLEAREKWLAGPLHKEVV